VWLGNFELKKVAHNYGLRRGRNLAAVETAFYP
jgi:hypothetical protein